ncbi:DsbA family protein [Candidatus Uhrbacteria bacterium]|nr:DsbA family protein [Candidatus Uhrbacteria bacterium]
MFHEDSKTGGITLSPKMSFIVGLVGGILVLCTIGFFILLGVMLKGGVALGAGNNDGGQVAVNTPPPAAPNGGAEPVGTVKPVGSDDHVRGSKNAQVTLIEYSDFECPFCGRFHPTMVQLMKEYEGKVKWVYRHYPLSFHPQAMPAALASECASEQGKFWEFADKVFANQTSLNEAYIKQVAGELKLNTSKFNDCYASKKYQTRVTSDLSEGSTAGVTGTPGTIILGKDGSKSLVPGAVPYEQLKAMVDAAL